MCVIGLPDHDDLLVCQPFAVLEFLFQMTDEDFSRFFTFSLLYVFNLVLVFSSCL